MIKSNYPSEDNIPSREWLAYKLQKASVIGHEGYFTSLEREPDNWLRISRFYLQEPELFELRADVLFFMTPSKYGIDQGKISKLGIKHIRSKLVSPTRRLPRKGREWIYNYDRGLDMDRLAHCPEAQPLYDLLIEVLNK